MEGVNSDPFVIQGNLLVSEPFMVDTHFGRAVILVCSHEDQLGTVGFILNKPMAVKVSELIPDFPEFESQVYYGGPVAPDTIHFVHDCGGIVDDSEVIKGNISWGGDFDTLKFLVKTELIQPRNIKFFLGYSGWGPMQLKDEFEYGSWVSAEMHPNYVLNADDRTLWSEVMKHKGTHYTVISQIPFSNILN